MNVIEVCGGLGNQLFQYAFGRAMEEYGTKVKYDITWYDRFHGNRPYMLDKFNTTIETVHTPKDRKVFIEVEFNPSYVQMDGFYFHGYWQSPKYHENVFPKLKEEFTVKKELYTDEFLQLYKKIKKENSVAVHVRRGDFLEHHRHYVTSLHYYQNAMQIISTLKKNTVFYMFSDDMQWCKENFDGINFVHLEEHLDFELIKACKHHIIPNSTFSLWAAYLTNSKGTKIAPRQWDKYPTDQKMRVETKCLLPNDWIKLENV